VASLIQGALQLAARGRAAQAELLHAEEGGEEGGEAAGEAGSGGGGGDASGGHSSRGHSASTQAAISPQPSA